MATRKSSKTAKRSKRASSAASTPQRRVPAREIFGILLITFAAMAALSLLSYDALDYPKGSRMGADVANLLGPFGANVAFNLSEFTFGRHLSLILPLFLLYAGIDLLRGRGQRLLRRQALPLLTGVILASAIWSWFRLVLEHGESTELTGLVGVQLRVVLVNTLGVTGAALVLFATVLIWASFSLRISWGHLASLFAERAGETLAQARPPARKKKPGKKKAAKKREATTPGWKKKPASEPEPVEDGDADDIDDEWNEFKKGVAPAIVTTPRVPGRGNNNKAAPSPDQKARPEDFILPDSELLVDPGETDTGAFDEDELRERATELEDRLGDYGVKARVVAIHPGPVITRYDLRPAKGVKVSRISGLADDLAMSLSAVAVRIIAPIPGAGAVGIEVPNPRSQVVYLREIVESEAFVNTSAPLAIALGKTAQGDNLVVDLAKMPHLLIAGSTGAGKSVCINSIIVSLLMRNRPDQVQFVMIDPKKIELSLYSELRRHHLLHLEGMDEVIATEPRNAVLLLQSVVREMERRYDLLAETGARNLKEYNKIARKRAEEWEERRVQAEAKGEMLPEPDDAEHTRVLPHVVTIIDELADLMMLAAREVEEPIARLAQMARAVGIHLIVATQRPSVNVITGVIKANFPARIAFMVPSNTDSRTIIDRPGAKALLGNGDGLFLSNAAPTPVRFHGAFVSTEEVQAVIAHIHQQPMFVKSIELTNPEDESSGDRAAELAEDRDPLFDDAVKLVARHQQGSVSLLQRRLKIGYSRAGRLLDQLEMAGVVGPFEGSKAREVYLDTDQVEAFLAGDLEDEDDD